MPRNEAGPPIKLCGVVRTHGRTILARISMSLPLSRRDVLKATVAPCLAHLLTGALPTPARGSQLRHVPGAVSGLMTGAKALVETLIQEGADCVFGIPGAQENEVWDAMKSRGL